MLSETKHPGGPGTDCTIEARGVTKRFGPVVAVDRLSFDVRRGEVVGLLGPNGAGKTTTMRLLTGFYTPDGGRIVINGADTQEQERAAKHWIGFLPENNPLYGDMLVRDYLTFVADLRGMSPPERRASMERTVEEAGIAEVYYRPIGQLSKGNRQRVGMAQAILHRPEILVMDEPTEGLDPNQRLVIRDLIRSLGADRTVLLSTHVLGEVESTCDRVLVISEGRLVADGSVAELLEQGGAVRSVTVEARGEGVREALEGLPGVTSVVTLGGAMGRERHTLAVAGGEDPRPGVFELAKSRGWALWELHEETAGLESVFQHLTAGHGKETE